MIYNRMRALYDSTNNNLERKVSSIDSLEIKNDLTELVTIALEGTSRVIKIVAELREFSHQDEENPEKQNINTLIDKAISLVLNEIKYKAEIFREYGSIPTIYCWGDKLVQVFINLLVNAAQSIEEKGEIKILTVVIDDYLNIEISDNGKGMDEKVQSKIFDPFYTTKEVGVGMGLGLHISYKIIENHGGYIKVKSKEGQGTSIKIQLPMDNQLLLTGK